MYENIVNYLEAQVTDTASSRPANSAFVSLGSADSKPYLPAIKIEIGGGSGSQTGINNNMETRRFGILILSADPITLIDLADEAYHAMKLDTGRFFFTAKMYRAEDYIQPYNLYPHEKKVGEFYAKFTVTFDFFHGD